MNGVFNPMSGLDRTVIRPDFYYTEVKYKYFNSLWIGGRLTTGSPCVPEFSREEARKNRFCRFEAVGEYD